MCLSLCVIAQKRNGLTDSSASIVEVAGKEKGEAAVEGDLFLQREPVGWSFVARGRNKDGDGVLRALALEIRKTNYRLDMDEKRQRMMT